MLRTQGVALKQGQLVYVRSYSTRRAGVAEVLAVVHEAGRDWGQVRLATEWYDWDEGATSEAVPPAAGEMVQVETYRLEPVRLS